MLRRSTQSVSIFYLCLVGLLFCAPTAAEEWEWDDVSRIVAVGDLHGSHEKLVQLMTSAELINDDQQWIGGDAHLVIAGDFLDRGPGDRLLMDLLRRLQDESLAAGGRVHVLLGNHEEMNLVRDVRDVSDDSFALFEDEEIKADRKLARRSFMTQSTVGGGINPDLLPQFKARFPPGYFGRQRAFDRDGEYGAWLLEQPAVVKLNGILFVHGGLTTEFAALGGAGINREVREQLQRHLAAREVLEDAGIVHRAMEFSRLRATVEEAMTRKRKPLSGDLREAGQAFLESGAAPILGARGPLWYRGHSLEDERIERDMLERSLELLGAESMVVAHSYTGGNRITMRFEGQLFRLDHNLLGSPQPLALVVEGQEVMVLDSTTRQRSQPVREMPYGLKAPLTALAPDEELEGVLAKAPIVESRELGRGSTRPRLLVLEDGKNQRRGIWKNVEEGSDRYQHELAAYLVDRQLGLGMVPVTVLRNIDGKKGSLQLWIERAIDRQAATNYDLTTYGTETALRKLAQAKVFDALIGVEERDPADFLILVTGQDLFLVDHSEAFTEEPLNGDAANLQVPAELATALRSLETLQEDLQGLLGEEQIRALFKRRDAILAATKE